MSATTAATVPEHNFHPRYRPDIDGLRAVAVLSVVAFHAFPGWLPGGFIGVDIFFVISGFLISSILFRSLARGDFSFGEFYAHRAKRIFPALVVVLVAVLGFGYFTLLPDELKRLGDHVMRGAVFLENFLLNNEAGYFDVGSELKPLMHLWSLGVEEQFYLAYPLIIWLGWRLRLNLGLLVAAIAVVSFGVNVRDIASQPVATFFLPHTRFWELMAGGLLAWINLYARDRFEALSLARPGTATAERRKAVFLDLVAAAGLALIVLALVILDRDTAFPGWWALAPVLGAWLAIAGGPGAWPNRVLLGNRVLVFVGAISYPLYLWHWPLLAYARIIVSGTPPAVVRVAMVVLAILLAWLTYRLIERPVRFGAKTWVKVAVPSALLVAAGALGGYVQLRAGLPERNPVLAAIDRQLQVPPEMFDTMPGCLATYPYAKSGFCLQSQPGRNDTMLIGDSHAQHLFPGLAPYYADHHVKLVQIGKGGCPPLFDLVKRNAQGKVRACGKVMNAALSDAIADADVGTVILSFRGVVTLTGRGFGDAEEEKDIRLSLPGLPGVHDNAAVLARALHDTLARLVATGKRIIFVIDVPEIGFDPKSCFAMPTALLTRPATTVPCVVARRRVDARTGEYWALMRRTLADFPSVEVFDPVPYLCDDVSCSALRDGQLLYRDPYSHLSVAGSRLVAKAMVERLHLP